LSDPSWHDRCMLLSLCCWYPSIFLLAVGCGAAPSSLASVRGSMNCSASTDPLLFVGDVLVAFFLPSFLSVLFVLGFNLSVPMLPRASLVLWLLVGGVLLRPALRGIGFVWPPNTYCGLWVVGASSVAVWVVGCCKTLPRCVEVVPSTRCGGLGLPCHLGLLLLVFFAPSNITDM
jgi:hypothetical protein